MTGVILAAGMALRLHPLTDGRPKCLLPIGTKTLIQRTIDAMVYAGIKDFVVVTGYRGDMIEQALTAYLASRITITFLYNADYESTDSIFSLWIAMNEVRGTEFLLMDCDILCDQEVVKRTAIQEGSALALKRHETTKEDMKVVVDHNMHITAISKSCPPEEAFGETLGIQKCSAEYSEALAVELDQLVLNEGVYNMYYELAFERLIEKGHTFHVVDTTDLFSIEIDTLDDYYHAQELARKGIV